MAQPPQPRITLFSSSVSQRSQHAEGIIRQAIPSAKIIRLDTKAQREWAASGTTFSVREVPTLLIQHPNGQVERRVGIDQIAGLFRPPAGGKAKGRAPRRPGGRPGGRSTGGGRRDPNMYDDPEGWRSKVPRDDDESEGDDYNDDSLDYLDDPTHDPAASKRRPGRPTVVEESSEDEAEVPPQKPVKKVRIQEPKKSGRSRGSGSARGRAEADRKLAAAKEVKGITSSQKRGKEEADKKLQGLNTKKKSGPRRMKSIMAEAKKQEADLKRALEE